jgi:signal transduction histidine kinase/ligand-binding sensor domain-containing protein
MLLSARKCRTLAWCLFAWISLVAAGRAHCQIAPDGVDYLIHVWSSEDGLPQNSVNCLAQTRDGYLWVGTRSGGLARFDGMRFVAFNPQSTPELQDVESETMSVDSCGTLWITAGNESIVSVTDGKFHLVRERNAIPRWHPLQLVGEAAGSVYFAAYGSAVFRVPRKGQLNAVCRIALAPLPLPGSTSGLLSHEDALWYVTAHHAVARLQLPASSNAVCTVFHLPAPAQVLAKDVAGELWVATGRGVGLMTHDGFSDRTPSNGPGFHGINQLIPTRDGSLWVCDRDHLGKMSKGKWILTAVDFLPATNHPPLSFYADSLSGLWIIEYGRGLWHVHPDGKAELLTPESGLPSALITCWLEDYEGNIWVGTKEAGLVRIRRSWFRRYGVSQGIPGEVALSVCEDAHNTIWVGTATGGLAWKKGETFIPVQLPSTPHAAIENVTVFPDATNGIWIGTRNDSFRYVDGEITRPFPPAQSHNRVVNVVMQDSLDRVWFGNGSGTSYFQNGELNTFGSARGFAERLGVRALAEGPPGTLWLGTGLGDVWQFANDKPIRHHPPPGWPDARVSALLPDTDGSVWVGTLGGGLMRFQNGAFTRITTKQGLPDNSITQLLADEDGNLWGGTYAGIFRAAKGDLKKLAAGAVHEIAWSVFGRFEGLPAQANSGWYQPSCWRSRDGQLWFTTVKGLVAVNPRQVAINRHPPPVVIEEVRVDGEPCALETGSDAKEKSLRIPPGRHYVDFRFTGIDFIAPDKLRFKWRLEGVEKQWHESVNQRSIGYGPLLPGKYSFSVLAANSDGVWNESGAHVALIVPPFFWETWWFKSALLAAAGAGLTLAVTLTLRRRHNMVLERLERRNEMERERARIAQDLHDDLGTSLTQIGLLSTLLTHKNTSPARMESLTQQIRSTSRTMVTELNEIVWAVNPKNDSLNELVGYLGNFAEAFFRLGAIRCHLDIPSDLPEYPLAAEVRHGIFLAFKEAINNVAKHSRAKVVLVKIHCEGDLLHLAIEDDGIGFDPAKESAGNGLANMKNRLKKMGGSCDIRSIPGGATTVLFQLKFRP